MNTKTRSAIFHYVLSAITLGLALMLGLPQINYAGLPIHFVLTFVLVIVLANLGLPMTRGTSTFVPVMALVAYLTMGLRESVWVVVVGLLVASGVLYGRSLREQVTNNKWWVTLSNLLWPVPLTGLSLFVADLVYRQLGATPPMTELPTLPDLLPVVGAYVLFLMVYNVLNFIEVWVAAEVAPVYIRQNWRIFLPVQILPAPLAVLSAVALTALGLPAYVMMVAVILTIAIVVNYLLVAQSDLRSQVRQLSSFSFVNRAVRASLDLDELLETIYLQAASILNTENFYIALLDGDGDHLSFPLVLRDGRQEVRPRRERGNYFEERVIDAGEALLVVQDVEGYAQREDVKPPEKGLYSWMGVPLRASSRTLGCVAIYSLTEAGGEFDKEDLEIFSNIAVQAGVAIENALLYRNVQQHARQLTTLSDISTVMNASLDPDKVLGLVSESVIRVAGCDKAAIYLLEPNGESLKLAQAEGFTDMYLTVAQTVSVPLSEAERDAVMETGEANAVPDIRRSKDVSPGLKALAEQEKFRAYANYPLRAYGHTIGLLAVYYDKPHQFEDGELELLRTFANQAALAVANARRYTVTDQQLARRIDQIAMLADVNRKLSATLDIDRIFHMMIDSVMEACRAIAGMVLVLEGDEKKPRIGAWRGYPIDVVKRLEKRMENNQPNGNGISTRVLKTGNITLIDNVAEDPEFVNMGIATRSQLSVPILLEEKVMGAITLESDEEAAFNHQDVDFVGQLAGQAAIAMKNAQLYQRVGEVNDRLHAILDASTDGLLMLDTRARIVMTNTAMEQFWDFARNDFEERSVEKFVADPLSALGEGLGYADGELHRLLNRSIEDGSMVEQSDLYVASGATPRFIERSVRPVHDEYGNPIGLLLVFRDVTEQKELEEARENLGNMIVHDLRNPLTAVLASLTLVNNVVGDKDKSGMARQAMEVSGRAVRKLLVMVNNLLDMSRMDAGDFEVVQREASIQKVMENAVGELLPLAMEMEVTLGVGKNGKASDLPPAYIDRDMIERVIINLVDNALKFTPPGGHVTISSDVIELEDEDALQEKPDKDEAKPDNGADSDPQSAGAVEPQEEEKPPVKKMLRVGITDNGPGIPDDYKSRIFNRFTQIHGQTGRRRGTGLGLAFCYMAVTAHGGKIWVEDNPEGDKGSLFRFTLPLLDDKILDPDDD